MVPTFHSVGSCPLIRCIIAISVSLSDGRLLITERSDVVVD